jgi:hypothetical protein
MYHTKWPSIHIVALCCGCHNLKSGNRIHSSRMCHLSTRRNISMRSRVQFQISRAFPPLVRRRIVVSVSWQWRQRPSSVRCVLCRRSFVGVRSCATASQRDRTVRVRCLLLTFPHIVSHLTFLMYPYLRMRSRRLQALK